MKVHALLAALAAAGLAAGDALAQDSPVPAEAGVTGSVPQLLREGGFLMEQRGTLHREGTDWVFRTQPQGPNDPPYHLTLLPCTLLANLEQFVESLPDGADFPFDLTGEVFVYRGRNYLLPTHAPRLVEHVPPPPPPAADDDDDDAGESAEQIIRDLDLAVGPVARSPRAGAESALPDEPRLPPPGSVILWRRGWLSRDPGGAWIFVFSSDATGLADPPMVLLPCLMLQTMARQAQRSGPDVALLVSGRVYHYHGRAYLLPTMYQVPRHRTTLRP